MFAVDDTGNPRYGLQHRGTGFWHTSSKERYHGQKILVLALIHRTSKRAYPLAYVILRKKDDASYVSPHEMVGNLVERMLLEKFPKLPITMDTWYCESALIKRLTLLGITVYTEIKCDRNCRRSFLPRSGWMKPWKLFKLESKHMFRIGNRGKKYKYFSSVKGTIKGYRGWLKLVGAYNKRQDRKPFATYICTDLRKTSEEIWQALRDRWAIEVMFRDLKQHLNFGQFPSKCGEGTDLSICIPFALYTSLYLDSENTWGKEVSRLATLGAKIIEIKKTAELRTVQKIIDTPYCGVIQMLRFRFKNSVPGKKPRTHTLEELKRMKGQVA